MIYRKYTSFTFAICLLLCFCTRSFANSSSIPQDGHMPTTLTTLDNGMSVVITEMPQSELVSIYALIKTGSSLEGEYLGSGITHFVEHMLFKGTALRGVGDIAHEIQQLGGTINASTGKDHTMFTITLPREHFDKGLDIISDMLQHPAFDAEELKKEQQVITKEIRLHRDQPENYLSELIFDAAFQIHPYKIPIIGFEEVFLQITREDLLNYYKKMYVPNNMILSIAGGINKIAALGLVEETFEKFSRQTEVIRSLPTEPEQIAPRIKVVQYPTDLTRLSLSFQSTQLSHPDLFALDILAMLLGHGQSSRLYEDLFKKKDLVESVYASNYTPLDTGLFEISAVLSHNDIDEVVDNIYENIDSIKSKGVRLQELRKAKRQVISNFLSDYQRTSDYAYHTAVDQAFSGDFDFYRKYMEGIQKVSVQDIQLAAQKYLKKDRSCLVVLKPKQIEADHEIAEQTLQADVKQIILKNGLTLLLKEDHAIPLVSIFLAAKGGVQSEPADKNGLSALMSQTWTQGTKRLSAQEIATEIESRGASLGNFSSHDSLGLSLSVLTEDIDFGLDLFSDVILNPAFEQAEIESERGKILTAIAARNDSVFKQTMMALQENLFKDYYLGRTELGTEESVNLISRPDIITYYHANVKPNNMVLSVYGDFDAVDVEKTLKQKFSKLEMTPLDIGKEGQKAPAIGNKNVNLQTEKSQAIVMMGFRAPGMSHPDRYGIELLTAILGSSFEGRIFNKIREEFGQAYTLGGFFIPSQEEGMMVFYVATTNQYTDKVKELLLGIFADIRDKGVSSSELEDMRSYLKGRHQRGLETLRALGSRTALDSLFGLGHDHYQKYTEEIDKVTPEQISALSLKYLKESQAVVVTNLGSESGDIK